MPYFAPPPGDENSVQAINGVSGPGSTTLVWDTEVEPIGPELQPYAPANMTYIAFASTVADPNTTLTGNGPQFIRVDATLAASTVTLMPSGYSHMKMVTVVKVDSSANAVTVGKDSSDSWYAATGSLTLSAQWDSVTLVGLAEGSLAGWHVIATM